MFWGRKDKQKKHEKSNVTGEVSSANEPGGIPELPDSKLRLSGFTEDDVSFSADVGVGGVEETLGEFSDTARLGAIVSVLRRSSLYSHHRLEELEWLVDPALQHGQYVVVEAGKKNATSHKPVGLIIWATVSAEVDARLSKDPQTSARLSADDYVSGDNVWVLVGVGPRAIMVPTLQKMQEKVWQNKAFKFVQVDEDGATHVKMVRSAGDQPVDA